MKKIIIDTDIGDDIDDALAIALALKSPELEVVGITTVFRDTDKRAKIAKKLLQVAGFDDIPVYAGCQEPLIESVDPTELPNQYLEEMEAFSYNQNTHAVDYLIDCILNSPDDMIVAAIGPLTNIATAIIKEPRLKEKLKEIVMMGGSYTSHCNEYNIVCDPEAAKIVFASGIHITAIGIDVTRKCTLTSSQMNALYQSTTDLGRFLASLTAKWNQAWGYKIGTIILHDPLTIFAIFDSSILTTAPADVKVETHGELTRGFTFAEFDNWQHCFLSDKGTTHVAIAVDWERLGNIFIQRILS